MGSDSALILSKARNTSGVICLNGAAARKAQVGDKVIIMAYALYDESELENYAPKILQLGEKNEIIAQVRNFKGNHNV